MVVSMRMRVGCTCGSQNQPIHVKALSAEAEVAGKEEFNLQYRLSCYIMD
jgi:hypothetical protein